MAPGGLASSPRPSSFLSKAGALTTTHRGRGPVCCARARLPSTSLAWTGENLSDVTELGPISPQGMESRPSDDKINPPPLASPGESPASSLRNQQAFHQANEEHFSSKDRVVALGLAIPQAIWHGAWLT